MNHAAPFTMYGETWPNEVCAAHGAPTRPEPVVAPLPSEAVLNEVRYRIRTAVAYGLLRGKHGKESDPAFVDAQIAGMVESLRRLVPEDDEPAVIAVQVEEYREGPTFVRIERQGVPLVTGYVHPEPPDDDEDTVRAVDALSTAREQIRARRIHFRELGTDDQYLNALDDAFGLVSNLWRSHGGEGR
ncbi:hypothetical protein [Aeromicrobium sp. Leaf291]|uniref:hypothetical protein n=1 Tax=Aeromicrobium sp. Leaf291 TaxID=1736325 RepID=UPI0006FC86F6|nr:hypothetical protein [Aeromicrobium sp. Leaf291]KQP81624.1 hypothetical protein ASF35_16465 [Aeromicrobium sp. Leaf291]